jgi:uncharacterized lipoprotein YmbA
MRYLLIPILLLICSACIRLGAEPQPARYYLLAPQEETQSSYAMDNLKLALGPISFPPYLDRPQLVTRNSRNEIVVAEFDRWAEPLRDNLLRVLKENLARKLIGATISDYPWQPTDQRGLNLQLTINQFDAVLQQQSSVDIRWVLFNANGTRELDRGHFVAQRQIGGSHEEMVSGLNASLNQLSEHLSRAISMQKKWN